MLSIHKSLMLLFAILQKGIIIFVFTYLIVCAAKRHSKMVKGHTTSPRAGVETLGCKELNHVVQHYKPLPWKVPFEERRRCCRHRQRPWGYSLWLAQHGYGGLTACRFLKKRKRNIAQWL